MTELKLCRVCGKTKFGTSESPWKTLEQQMPFEGQKILVTTIDGIHFGILGRDGRNNKLRFCVFRGSMIDLSRIKKWMPIPEWEVKVDVKRRTEQDRAISETACRVSPRKLQSSLHYIN